VQNMKYNSPELLLAMLKETQVKINQYQALSQDDAGSADGAAATRMKKDKLKEDIERDFVAQTPLKWVNRLIMWCAEGMPSFGANMPGKDANEVTTNAMNSNSEIQAAVDARKNLIKMYKAAA